MLLGYVELGLGHTDYLLTPAAWLHSLVPHNELLGAEGWHHGSQLALGLGT